jgi:hypothetical protein
VQALSDIFGDRIFGEHVHLILILVIFLLRLLEGQSLQQSQTEELKKNICKEIANILAEHLKRVKQNCYRQ